MHPYITKAVSVTVPSITDPDIATVATTVTLDCAIALGDLVIAAPTEALPTNCRFQNAYPTAANTITFVFGSEGGSVTGAAKTFNIAVFDITSG